MTQEHEVHERRQRHRARQIGQGGGHHHGGRPLGGAAHLPRLQAGVGPGAGLTIFQNWRPSRFHFGLPQL